MNRNQSQRGKNQKTAKKLIDSLAEINSDTMPMSMEDNEMLSLIVDETLKGVDITTRYQTFYQKLLNSAELRQAFIDAIVAIEIDKKGEMIPLPGVLQSNLDFLTNETTQHPVIKRIEENQWKMEWQQTIERLQAIFFSLEPVLRSRPSLFEDTWFTILRGETDLQGMQYLILLECGISDDTSNALSAFLSVAVTLKSTIPVPQFPLYATLNWGKYSETLTITEEGRMRFPDIPFILAFDKEYQNITSELKLELVTSS